MRRIKLGAAIAAITAITAASAPGIASAKPMQQTICDGAGWVVNATGQVGNPLQGLIWPLRETIYQLMGAAGC
jgi:hypothetical protein